MVSINKAVTQEKGKTDNRAKTQWKACTLLRIVLHYFYLPHTYDII